MYYRHLVKTILEGVEFVKRYFRILIIFAIMSVLVIGCSNKEEKTALDQNGNKVNTQENNAVDQNGNKGNTEEKSASQDVDNKEGQADQTDKQQTSDNQDKSTTNNADQTGGESNMPSFTVNLKPGMVPQQRLVEVKVDTENPNDYYVAVETKVLQYRESVGLYVGLIDSNDEDAIKKSVQVFKKSS